MPSHRLLPHWLRAGRLLVRRHAGRPRGAWSLATPVLFQELAMVLSGAVVLWLASHLGASAVAAIGMIDALGNLLHALFTALAIGATVTAAHCVGARREGELPAVAGSGLLLGLGAGGLLALVLWFTRPAWIALIMPGVEPAVSEQADDYFRWLILADLPTGGVLVACGLLRGMGRTAAATRINVVMNLLHVALGAGLMHLAGWGVSGAGAALLAARVAALLLALHLLRRALAPAPGQLHGPRLSVERRYLRSIARVGWPAALESSFFHVGKLITQSMVAGLGTTAMAANFIAFSVAALMNIPGNALGVAATTLVGQRLGARDTQGARRKLLALVRSATLALSTLAALVLPFASPLVGLFGRDPEVMRHASRLIMLNCLFMPVWALSFVLPAGLRGAGDTRYAMWVATAGMWLFRIATGYLLGIVLGLGVVGIWFGMFADWVVRGLLFWRRARGDRWTRHSLLG
ncbi:MATE family efflux transporter [Caldimonas tepidiphila]|uniref:MATE family efflux transporter n=1 Tax=Caldimonas tepidiphila TaxID=2315841 RepID=UPI000E5BBD1E|nr:MATE family efflux transporter [Caldimonas tepidiphila]